MPFPSNFDWVPRGLAFTDTTRDLTVHFQYGDQDERSNPNFLYGIEVNTTHHGQLTPSLELDRILSDQSKSLIVVESLGPEEPGFGAPEAAIRASCRSLGLRDEQVKRVFEKRGSLTDYFYSDSESPVSAEISFRWTSLPGCYVLFLGKFTADPPKGPVFRKRMTALVSHRGLFPVSSSAELKNKDVKKEDENLDAKEVKEHVMEPNLEFALKTHADKIKANQLRVFSILLGVCVNHLDEEIHELQVKLEGITTEGAAHVANKMTPDICALRKACKDLLAICEDYIFQTTQRDWLLKWADKNGEDFLAGVRRDVYDIKMLVGRRLEKLSYIDGVCSRMVISTNPGGGYRHIEY